MNIKSNTIWVMEKRALQAFLKEPVQAGLIEQIMSEPASKQPYELVDGVAQIPIFGVIYNQADYYDMLYMPVTRPKDVSAAVDEALKDPNVHAIELLVNSPGGTIDGVKALSDKIFYSRGQKPIVSTINGIAASAAFWIASQADYVQSDETSEIGSIGAYLAMYDNTRQLNEAGIDAYIIASDDYKAAGVPGNPITDEQVQAEFEIVQDTANIFKADVTRARPQIAQENLKGRTWIAGKALEIGLIDNLTTTTQENQDMNLSEMQNEMLALKTKLKATEEEKEDMEEEKEDLEAKVKKLEDDVAAIRKLLEEKEEEVEKKDEEVEQEKEARKQAETKLLIQSQIEAGCTLPDFYNEDGTHTALGKLAHENKELFLEMCKKVATFKTVPTTEKGGFDNADTDLNNPEQIKKYAAHVASQSKTPEEFLKKIFDNKGGK